MRMQRNALSDFWDAEIDAWLRNRQRVNPMLDRWFQSYNNRPTEERSEVIFYPDPFVGDVRGLRKEPRIATLGINPGEAYPELQSRDGTWSDRILELGYSRCFCRSPAEDPESWLRERRRRGKHQSPFWSRLVKFAQRWLDDPSAGVADIVNFELYPWHSGKVHGSIAPASDIIHKYVFGPLSEFATNHVFAFGAPWFDLANAMGLAVIKPAGQIPGSSPKSHWTAGTYEMPSRQILVVSSYSGGAGPPGAGNLPMFRRWLEA